MVLKKSTKWLRTAVDPGLPGTRGRRIGARSLPVFVLKSSPGAGIAFSVSSDRLEYALATQTSNSIAKTWRVKDSRVMISAVRFFVGQSYSSCRISGDVANHRGLKMESAALKRLFGIWNARCRESFNI